MNMRNPYMIKPPRAAVLDRNHPLARGMSMCLLINELTGNRVWDAVRQKAYEFDETYPPLWTNGGVLIDSAYQHIAVDGFNDIFPAGGDGTIIIDYRTTIEPDYYVFYSLGSSYSNFGWLFYNDQGNGYIYFGGDYIIVDIDILGMDSVSVFAVTWRQSGTTLYVDFYKNGILADSRSATASVPTSSDTLRIGSASNLSDGYTGGIIKSLLAYSRSLSSAEIAQLSSNPYQIIQNPLSRRYYASSSSTVSVNIESESDVVTDAYRQRYASPIIESESSMSIEAFRRRFAEAIIQSESDMTVFAFRQRFTGVSIESESDLTMTAFRRRYLSMAIESESGIEASVYRRRYADLLIDSISDVIITLATETVSVIIESVSNVVVDAYRQRHADVEIASESEIEAEILRLVYASVEILSESDIEIDIEDLETILAPVILARVATNPRVVLDRVSTNSRVILSRVSTNPRVVLDRVSTYH